MSQFYRSSRKPWRFISYLFSSIVIISLISPSAAIPAFAASAPTPLYPEDYANTTSVTDQPLGVPSFTWSSVGGANVYRLQVDSEVGFNTPIVLDITTHNTSYTPQIADHLFADGEWYWRVRVEDPQPVGAWSSTMHFTKTWATPENKPVLTAPVEGESLAFFDFPTFSWQPVMGAARYRFQIATTPVGFDTPVFTSDTLSTSIQPSTRLANGLYYWRVLPQDRADHLGTPSDVQSFTASYGTYVTNMVPTQISPADETFPTFTPTFHWTAIEGAEHYRLEYTSEENCDFNFGTSVDTRQTFYTPTDTFSNDFRYCWHVRVESGFGVGDWSETWHFQKRWNLKPILLTPTQLYQTGLYPIYSWSPVPGAARYLVQISQNAGFDPIYEEKITANTTYAPQIKYEGTSHYWWRVRPIDGGSENGVLSDVSEYQSIYTSTSPILVYPLYYYLPNNYGQNTMNPYEDRTVAYPVFIWHRIMIPAPVGGNYAVAYRIQVDDAPYFTSLAWEYDTESTSATPTTSDGFTPLVGQDYYWRVCPLNYMGGSCLTNQDTGLAWWSQIWKARFDSSLQLQPSVGNAPQLLRPQSADESVEATPLLEWWPLQDATQYQLEISRESSFSTYEISETMDIPAFSSSYSLAQRNIGRTDYGTFYWRVRGLTGTGWSDWSDVWHFQVASQSEWRYTRTLGDPDNLLDIASDPADADTVYDLTTLYASQASNEWYFGFDAEITETTDTTYVFYLDLDNTEGSGAPASPPPPRDYQVTTAPEHQPEFAIYVDLIGGVIDNQNTWVYAWNGTSWGFGQRFADIGGSVYYTPEFVELKVPNGAIGMTQDTSSTSISLFSINLADGTLVDSVPSDPTVPGVAVLSRFSAVSERLNLIYPPNTVTGDPTSIPSVLPFYWDWPTGGGGSSPFAGSVLEVDVDQDYSPPHEAEFEIESNTGYFGENNVVLLKDVIGDNIYYWRVQPRYLLPGEDEAFGAWASGWSFQRQGFTAQNLTTSVTFATPTFSWDMVEGAENYRIQVSTDPNFGSFAVNTTTPMNSFTPRDTLAQGLYYWRVQVSRYSNTITIWNDWSQVEQFTLSLPTPTGLSPNLEVVHSAPHFCWDPLVGFANGEPVLTAWKYRIQVSTDPNFSSTYETRDTDSNCWTPTKGYKDGTFYWRVAMIDGNNRLGSYSDAATFTKQYPLTILISPIDGAVPGTPTFIWTPVDGAASYRFEVSLFSSFTPLKEAIDTINTQFTPTSVYESDKLYYWRVAIRDRDGNLGPFTDTSIIIGVENYIFMPLMIKEP